VTSVDRSGEPLIRVEGVWKIFGRHADRVMGTPDADLGPAVVDREPLNLRQNACREKDG